jgi:hypothetical protein
MFVFAIETCGRNVALIQADARPMLDSFVNGDSDEGRVLRRDIVQPRDWDGLSPFTARLATPSEELDYRWMNTGLSDSDGESTWYFYGDMVACILKAERDKLKLEPR